MFNYANLKDSGWLIKTDIVDHYYRDYSNPKNEQQNDRANLQTSCG